MKVESLVAAPPPVSSAAALSPVASASPVFPVELESAEGDTKMVADEVDALMGDFFAKGDVAEDDIYIQFGDTITTFALRSEAFNGMTGWAGASLGNGRAGVRLDSMSEEKSFHCKYLRLFKSSDAEVCLKCRAPMDLDSIPMCLCPAWTWPKVGSCF